jgi:hypothetical protein
MSLLAVDRQIYPRLGHDDAGLYACVLFEEVEQVTAVDEFERLARCEVPGCLPVAARRDEDALGGALVLHCPEQVPDRTDADSIFVPLGLDDDLPAENGAAVEGDTVDPAVPRRWVWRVSSPILPNRLVMSPSNSVGVRSIRFGRWSRLDMTSTVSTNRGSNMSSCIMGFTGASSAGACDTDAFRDRRHCSGWTWAKLRGRKASTVNRTVSKQTRSCCPVAGLMVSSMPFRVRQSTTPSGAARNTVSTALRATRLMRRP